MAGEREAEDELPAMKDNPKYIFFTDFDGTITLDDSTLPFAPLTNSSDLSLVAYASSMSQAGSH